MLGSTRRQTGQKHLHVCGRLQDKWRVLPALRTLRHAWRALPALWTLRHAWHDLAAPKATMMHGIVSCPPKGLARRAQLILLALGTSKTYSTGSLGQTRHSMCPVEDFIRFGSCPSDFVLVLVLNQVYPQCPLTTYFQIFIPF